MINAVYDLTGCANPNPKPDILLAAMRETAELLGCTIRAELPVTFQPHGATCVLVLAESHLTISTWPEHHLAHLDLFTCRADTDPEHAITPILALFESTTVHGQRIVRLGPAASRGLYEGSTDGASGGTDVGGA
jgi:S-adenosylmethionine decarboxylase proenzyme